MLLARIELIVWRIPFSKLRKFSMLFFGIKSIFATTFRNCSRKLSIIFLHFLDLRNLTDSENVEKTAFIVSNISSGVIERPLSSAAEQGYQGCAYYSDNSQSNEGIASIRVSARIKRCANYYLKYVPIRISNSLNHR